ncbi:CHASE2 domain-containing protein [Monaibacterium marinum]|nr:CHASE2 domain-containing protein [Monaibacterium marinum]
MPGAHDGTLRDQVVIILIDDNDLFGECGQMGIMPSAAALQGLVAPECNYGVMGGPRPIESYAYEQLIQGIAQFSPDAIFLDLVFPGDQPDIRAESIAWSHRFLNGRLSNVGPQAGTHSSDTGIIAGSDLQSASADGLQRRGITIFPSQNAVALGQVLAPSADRMKWGIQYYYAPADASPLRQRMVRTRERERERLAASVQLYFWKCALETHLHGRQQTNFTYPGCASSDELETNLTTALREADQHAMQAGGRVDMPPYMSLTWARGPDAIPDADGGQNWTCPLTSSLQQRILQGARYLWRSLFSTTPRDQLICDYFLTLSATEFWQVVRGTHSRTSMDDLQGRIFLIGTDYVPFHDRHDVLDVTRHGTEFHAMALDNLLRLGADFKAPTPDNYTLGGFQFKGSPDALLDALVVTALLTVRVPLPSGRFFGCYDMMRRFVRARNRWLAARMDGVVRFGIVRGVIHVAILAMIFAVLLVTGIVIGLILYRFAWHNFNWSGFNWVGTAGLFAAAGSQGFLNISQQLNSEANNTAVKTERHKI